MCSFHNKSNSTRQVFSQMVIMYILYVPIYHRCIVAPNPRISTRILTSASAMFRGDIVLISYKIQDYFFIIVELNAYNTLFVYESLNAYVSMWFHALYYVYTSFQYFFTRRNYIKETISIKCRLKLKLASVSSVYRWCNFFKFLKF